MATSGTTTAAIAHPAYGWVYLITNTVNGNTYVGQTKTSIPARWIKHKSDARLGKDTPFCAAIRKYGHFCFSIEIVATCDDKDALNLMEIQYIRELKPTYNCTAGGGGLGSPTNEVRAKISEALKGRTFSEDTRKRISDGIRGRKLSAESRAKLSASLRRRAAELLAVRGPKPKRVRKPYVSPNEALFAAQGVTGRSEKIAMLAKKEYDAGTRRKLCGPDNPMYGQRPPKEVLERLSAQFSGTGNPFYGKTHSDSTRSKMVAAHASRPKISCPHCAKVGAHNAMLRWHFDKCKAATV